MNYKILLKALLLTSLSIVAVLLTLFILITYPVVILYFYGGIGIIASILLAYTFYDYLETKEKYK